jgi:MerR family transcriptional regulator, light-induced transcriptional regulator
MVSDGAADDYHVPPLGAPIGDGDDDLREEGVARAALHSARLRKVVRDHIVPRLTLLHRDWRPTRSVEPPSPEEIDAFGAAILGTDPLAADQLFQRWRDKGLTANELFENLLAPTARRFGELWFEDVCDFVEVTIGVNRLRMMLEAYACAPSRLDDPGRRILLITTPQEGHRFGLDVVANFLRESGWETQLEIGRPAADNAAVAGESWFALAAVTLSKEINLTAAARAIEAVRRASLNPAIAVIVGGLALRDRPDLVARMGGDATASDGPSAVILAEKLYIEQATAPRLRA